MVSTAPQAPEGYKLTKKKPFYKRVWFWLLVILVVIIAEVNRPGSDGRSVQATSRAGVVVVSR